MEISPWGDKPSNEELRPQAEKPWRLLLVMALLIGLAMLLNWKFVHPHGEELPNLFRGF